MQTRRSLNGKAPMSSRQLPTSPKDGTPPAAPDWAVRRAQAQRSDREANRKAWLLFAIALIIAAVMQAITYPYPPAK